MDPRKIIHVDMDAFYAAVEQRDNPELRGKPVVVGGSSRRGVVCTASYEARKFGVRSAMSGRAAYLSCPHAVFVSPRFDVYKTASSEVMEIFRQYTDTVEPLSLDEAYLDVTHSCSRGVLAREIAKEIRKKIWEKTALTASAGVGPNKFIAKLASDMNKPDGLTVIPPEKVWSVLYELPVVKLPGVGKVTEEKMLSHGIRTTRDLRERGVEELIRLFGKSGGWFYNVAHGRDERVVHAARERKSVGAEDTFAEDILDRSILLIRLEELAARVHTRLRGMIGSTVTVKVTYAGYRKITRSYTTKERLDHERIFAIASELLSKTEAGVTPVRLLGVSISNFDKATEQSKSMNLLPEKQLSFNWL